MLDYMISKHGDRQSITVITGDGALVTDDTNPNFEVIVHKLVSGDTDDVAALFSLESQLEHEFRHLSDRVSVSRGVAYFDGDPVEGPLADHLVRTLIAGGNPDWLVKFWENVASNPTEHSRENLYRWLNTHDFEINDDGYIFGYKGLRNDMHSVHAGPGIVNGVAKIGNLDNSVGNVLEMARSEVQHDPNVACSTGLHVGTKSYADSFGEVTVEVLVNPRDVVSVPVDCNGEKMRVRRYVVTGLA